MWCLVSGVCVDLDASASMSSGSLDIASGSVDMPSVDLTGVGPDMPSVGGEISKDLPSAGLKASGSLSSGVVDVSMPSGSVDIPSVDVKRPKKSLIGSIGSMLGSGKGKVEVSRIQFWGDFGCDLFVFFIWCLLFWGRGTEELFFCESLFSWLYSVCVCRKCLNLFSGVHSPAWRLWRGWA